MRIFAQQTWQDVSNYLPTVILPLMGYIAWWLRTHVGKSNGKGPVNTQLEDIHTKLDTLTALQRPPTGEPVSTEPPLPPTKP